MKKNLISAIFKQFLPTLRLESKVLYVFLKVSDDVDFFVSLQFSFLQQRVEFNKKILSHIKSFLRSSESSK